MYGHQLGATVDLVKDDKNGNYSDYRLTVHDRFALDQAMADFLAGTRKPVLRRYTADMLYERLTIMGPPQSLIEQIEQKSLASGTLLPDLSAYRSLARASLAYAKLLIQEGHPDEARPFIDAWQPLCVQVTDDSFTLLDILVAGSIADYGRANVVALYHALGDKAAEARTLQVATTLNAPLTDYKTRFKARSTIQDTEQAEMIRQHGGALAAVLLPALGEPVTEEELRPGRLVEYVLLDQTACGITNLTLLAIIFAALLVALRWRLFRGNTSAPLLLLPDTKQTLRIVGYGVILPLLVYFLWAKVPVLGGRNISLTMALPFALTQAGLLTAAIAIVTVTLAARAIRTRCETLEVATPPAGPGRWILGGFAVCAGLTLALAQGLLVLFSAVTGFACCQGILRLCLGVLDAALGLTACVAFFRYLLGSARFGLYRGTVARSLIPYLALSMVLIAALTNPYLRGTEARLVHIDPLMPPVSRTSAGFSVVESRLVEHLRTEMLKAAGR